MTDDVEFNALKKSAKDARELFAEESRKAIKKSYSDEVSERASIAALRWLSIANGFETMAQIRYAELCGVTL